MAKRQTDSNKWDDPWFFELSHQWKLVWIYILDRCDHAGVYEPNLRKLNFDLDTSLNEDEIIEVFSDRLQVLDKKWFIPKFILFQYGKSFIDFLQSGPTDKTHSSKVFTSVFNRLILLGKLNVEKGLIIKIKPFDNP